MNTMQPRVGIGHDTHRLIPGDGIRIGGVFIPHDKSLLGHSDADVLLHAVTDAILGAAAMGDIGDMFPDSDDVNRNRSSVEMLRLAYQKVRDAGWSIRNLDCIVFAERPKLYGYKADIATKIATTLEISTSQVNVKAKTGEGVGIVGEEIAIQAQCVALIIPSKSTPTGTTQALVAARPIPTVAPTPQTILSSPKAEVPASPKVELTKRIRFSQ